MNLSASRIGALSCFCAREVRNKVATDKVYSVTIGPEKFEYPFC